MASKLASESDWKALVRKFKLNDNGLQAALAKLDRLENGKARERVEALDDVAKLAARFKADRANAANADALKFIDGLIAQVQVEKRNITTMAAKLEASKKLLPDFEATTVVLDAMRKHIEKAPAPGAAAAGAQKGPAGGQPCDSECDAAWQARKRFKSEIVLVLDSIRNGMPSILDFRDRDTLNRAVADTLLKAWHRFRDDYRQLQALEDRAVQCLKANHIDTASVVQRWLEQIAQLFDRVEKYGQALERWVRSVPAP